MVHVELSKVSFSLSAQSIDTIRVGSRYCFFLISNKRAYLQPYEDTAR